MIGEAGSVASGMCTEVCATGARGVVSVRISSARPGVAAHLGVALEVEAHLGLPEVQTRLPNDAIFPERSPLGNGGASQGGALQDSPGALKFGRGASGTITE